MKKILRVIQLFLLAGVLSCLPAGAQTGDSEAADAPIIPVDELNRGTPLRAGDGFMAATDRGDFEAAAEFLDLRNLRGEASELTGAQLARRLFVIISRASWVDVDELIDDPAGRSNDNLPDYRDSIGVIRHGEKEVRLLMQKVPRSDGERIWKVSNATVSRIPDLYDTYGYPEIIEDLRRALPEGSFLGLELFKWVAALVSGALAYAAVFLIALIIRLVLRKAESPSRERIYRFLVLPRRNLGDRYHHEFGRHMAGAWRHGRKRGAIFASLDFAYCLGIVRRNESDSQYLFGPIAETGTSRRRSLASPAKQRCKIVDSYFCDADLFGPTRDQHYHRSGGSRCWRCCGRSGIAETNGRCIRRNYPVCPTTGTRWGLLPDWR